MQHLLSQNASDRKLVLENQTLMIRTEQHVIIPHEKFEGRKYYHANAIENFFNISSDMRSQIQQNYETEFAPYILRTAQCQLYCVSALLLFAFLLPKNPIAQGLCTWVLHELSRILTTPASIEPLREPTTKRIPETDDPLYQEKMFQRLLDECRRPDLSTLLQRLERL